MACFTCGSEATSRYTLHIDDGEAIEDKQLCEVCLSDFQRTEWIEVKRAEPA